MDYTSQILDGRYRILRLLGKGGMGSVWLGQHVVIGKNIAVKFLKSELTESDEMVKRFYREAQAAAAIGHSNIIEILDVGVSPSGDPYIIMEYLEGESLSSILRRSGPIDLAAALAVLEPALLALSAAHDKGIIHRDLKPDNIFISHPKDEPIKIKLIDFGISKFTETAGMSKLTRTGSFVGTPTYMSPEQIRCEKPIDIRSDLYSIGVILYEMLTGKLPITGEHLNAVVVNVLIKPPTPPKESYADFPMEAEPLLMRLLSKDPDDRPENARSIIEEIKKLTSYESREEHLTLYTTSDTARSCALGDLGSNGGDTGESQSGERKGARGILSEMSSKPTPADWSSSVAPHSRRKEIFIGLVIGAVVIAAAAFAFFFINVDTWSYRQPPPMSNGSSVSKGTPQKTGPTTMPKPARVEISITNVPEGAAIFFDGKPQRSSRFEVPFSKVEKTLRITVEGRQDYVRQVVPQKRMEIKVDMPSAPVTSANAETPEQAAAAETPEAVETGKTTEISASAKTSQPAATVPPSEPSSKRVARKKKTAAPSSSAQSKPEAKTEEEKKKRSSRFVKTRDGKKAVSSFE